MQNRKRSTPAGCPTRWRLVFPYKHYLSGIAGGLERVGLRLIGDGALPDACRLRAPSTRTAGGHPAAGATFVEGFSRRMNRNFESVPKQGMDALIDYSWPGNVRDQVESIHSNSRLR